MIKVNQQVIITTKIDNVVKGVIKHISTAENGNGIEPIYGIRIPSTSLLQWLYSEEFDVIK